MSMQRMHFFTLILVGSVYQITAVNTFSVAINASTNSIKPGENFSIDCSIFGLPIVDYLNSEVELLLRKNNSIINTVRVIKGEIHGENDKYSWTENFQKYDTCNIISVRFDVFNASSSDEGIYSFYTTHNSVTHNDSINLCSSNPEKSHYCAGTSRAVKTDSSVFTTLKCSNIPEVSTNNDPKLIIIIPTTVVGLLLIVVAVVWVIHRVHRKCGTRNVSVNNNEYIYSYPNETQDAATATIRRGLDRNFINLTEANSDLRNETHLNNEYELSAENSEYDVLRSKRENLQISLDANIYDRANNLVTGIYDSTLRRIETKE